VTNTRRLNGTVWQNNGRLKPEKQGAKRKKKMQECVTKQRHTETEEQGDNRKKPDCDFKRRNCEEMRHQSQSNREDMTNVVDNATKEAKQFLHRTQDPGNPHRHRTTVCILCNRFIIGTETIHKLTKKILVHTVKDLVSKATKSTTKPH